MSKNPKQEGTDLWDCRPQVGSCPNNCNQCFYNRPGAFYCDINEPEIPDASEVGDGIVRVNCGHDSNIERELVIETARQYKHYFFNTSIPNYDFPGPMVLTINRQEEDNRWIRPPDVVPPNLMFVRVRVSASNFSRVSFMNTVTSWVLADVPVVLTFMRYYEKEALDYVINHRHRYLYKVDRLYELKKHVLNEYYCPTVELKRCICRYLHVGHSRLLTMCGAITSNYCKDCMNCIAFYWQTKHRLDLLKELQE